MLLRSSTDLRICVALIKFRAAPECLRPKAWHATFCSVPLLFTTLFTTAVCPSDRIIPTRVWAVYALVEVGFKHAWA